MVNTCGVGQLEACPASADVARLAESTASPKQVFAKFYNGKSRNLNSVYTCMSLKIENVLKVLSLTYTENYKLE